MLFQVKVRLMEAGFSFHSGDSEPLKDIPELAGQHWYCWCGPRNAWDVETGESVATEEQAVLTALDALVAYATVATTPEEYCEIG